jgi:hypothetical protein
MDADRHDAVTDSAGAAIDREIQAALAVDPSPEFLARVRTRILTEPAGDASWLSWKLVASGAIAALIVIAVVVTRQGEYRPNARPEPFDSPLILSPSKDEPLAQDRPVVSLNLVPSKDEPLAQDRSVEGRARTPAWRADQPPPRLRRSAEASAKAEAPQARRRPEPEVLLDPAETRALRRLIAAARGGSLDLPAALLAATPTAMDLPPIDAIVIPPLIIDPLTPSGEEGVRP